MRSWVSLAACATVASAWPTAQFASGNQASFVLSDVEDRGEGSSQVKAGEFAPKKLHGQFLHITDIHPDPWYVGDGTESSSCHRLKPKKEKGRGSYWGHAQFEKCDSPDTLVNLTMQWLADEWADKVDFVIWTGDSARHDSDRQLPRTAKEIFNLNRRTVAQMEKVFTSRGVPLVPSLAHNIMYPGPNEVTQEYRDIWKSMIPFPAYQVFQRGAYFSVELIPDNLAAISLNTLYWYDSNKAVDGCPLKGEDPGRLELDWLEVVQLNMFRKRKMQVWMTGHVPPTLGNYYPECYRGYAQLALRFQDTIVGHLFGHMNVDHFFWLDVHELHALSTSSLWSRLTSSFFKKHTSLSKELLKDFKSLPPKKKSEGDGDDVEPIDYDDYVVVNVAPSVVPTYQPSVRVFSYNVTNWGIGTNSTVAVEDGEDEDADDEDDDGDDEDDVLENIHHGNVRDKDEDEIERAMERKHGHRHSPDVTDCTKKKNRDKKKCLLKGPRHAHKRSPSRRNGLWSPLGYTQYYISDLDAHNSSNPPKYEIEYMTYPLSALVPPTNWPVPQHLLPNSLRNLTQIPDDMKSDLVPFGLKDLTIPSWIKFARKLSKKKKLWRRFKTLMYQGGPEETKY
ncbi:Endopolyphosphatase [Tulasnella sp. 332]|nr:Endopolyphosphatase [Tulasnella sp. 332]